jgi:hypothetical protein
MALDWKMLIYIWPFVIFYGHLGYFMTICYILCTFFPVLVSRIKKNLATLVYNLQVETWQRFMSTFSPTQSTAGFLTWGRSFAVPEDGKFCP